MSKQTTTAKDLGIYEQTDQKMWTLEEVVKDNLDLLEKNPKSRIAIFNTEIKGKMYSTFVVLDRLDPNFDHGSERSCQVSDKTKEFKEIPSTTFSNIGEFNNTENKITYHSLEVSGIGHEFKSLEEIQKYYKNFPENNWKYVRKAFCVKCNKQRIIKQDTYDGKYRCVRCNSEIPATEERTN